MTDFRTLAIAAHALAAQSWDKGPHESDGDFSGALIAVGDALGALGQNIHDDFDSGAFAAASGHPRLPRLESRLASILMAATLSETDNAKLKESRFPAARIAAGYLEAFAADGDPATLSAAMDSLVQLAQQASERDTEARNAEARAERLAAEADRRAEDTGAAESDLARALARVAELERERTQWLDMIAAQAKSTQLTGSPFDAARSLALHCGLFAGDPTEEHAHGILAAAHRLESEACRKACEARDAVERVHKLNGDIATYRQQRDEANAAAATSRESLLWANTRLAVYRDAWQRLAGELGGLTLGQLPADSYGAAIAAALLAGKRDIAESGE